MKISELIKELSSTQEQYGDLELKVCDQYNIKGNVAKIYVAEEFWNCRNKVCVVKLD